MTSGRDKCGLSSFLSMSCRGRAEAFARRLHSRLRSLGSEDGNGVVNENSWLADHEIPVTSSQPRHTNADRCFDFEALESPGSPEEVEGTELDKLINKDNFNLLHSADCHCPIPKEKNIHLYNSVKSASCDSDSSDGPFYDTENDLNHHSTPHQHNGITNSHNVLSETDRTTKDNETVVTNDEIYVFSSDCIIPQYSSSSSDNDSTLCIKDEPVSPESNNSLPETFQKSENGQEKLLANDIDNDHKIVNNNETYTSCFAIETDFTVECPHEIQEIVSPSQHCAKLEFKDSVQSSVNDDDDGDIEETIPRVRRCSSLKTGKTPPGTPGRKKIVRFADVLGLDLADVRTFLDEIPKVPNSAYNDLTNVDLNESASDINLCTSLKFHGLKVDKILVPLFQQPGGQPNFIDKVRDNQVCLDNAMVDDPVTLSITGTVRVKNLDFHKSVHIRYSLDSWQTFADVQATYVENSCDGFSDKFSFSLFAHSLAVGQKLEFAIRFQCKGCQYWDNNSGSNYCFQCLPATNNAPSTVHSTMDDSWGASFYY